VSIRHLELAVVLVPVGQGEGHDVAAGVVDIDDVAVGGPDVPVIHGAARGIGDLDLHIAEVLGEDHRQRVPVDGGLDGGAFGNACDLSLFYGNLKGSTSVLNNGTRERFSGLPQQ